MIDSYEFGKIIVNGKTYSNDLIIFPDHIKADWWRKEGHLLQVDDLKKVFATKPKKLIIGTGYSGVMKVSEEVFKKAKELGIEIKTFKSEEACKRYNKEKDAILAIHLTC